MNALWGRRALAGVGILMYVVMMFITEKYLLDQGVTVTGGSSVYEVDGDRFAGFGKTPYLAALAVGFGMNLLYLFRLHDVDPVSACTYGMSRKFRSQLINNIRTRFYHNTIVTLILRKMVPAKYAVSAFSLYKVMNFIAISIIVGWLIIWIFPSSTWSFPSSPNSAGDESSRKVWQHGYIFYSIFGPAIIAILIIGVTNLKRSNRNARAIDSSIEDEDIIAALLFSVVPLVSAERDYLAQSGLVDPLTGVATRGALLRRIQEIDLEVKLTPNTPHGVIFFDFDDFKRINTRFEHEGGDEALSFVGKKLREISDTYPSWFPGRWGGDEFIVLVTGSRDQAVQGANEFVQAIRRDANTASNKRGLGEMISLSIGIAWSSDPNSDVGVEALIRRANSYAFYAKSRGKGKIISQADVNLDSAHILDIIDKQAAALVCDDLGAYRRILMCSVARNLARAHEERKPLEHSNSAARAQSLVRLRSIATTMTNLNRQLRLLRRSLADLGNIRHDIDEGDFRTRRYVDQMESAIRRKIHGELFAIHPAGGSSLLDSCVNLCDEFISVWAKRHAEADIAGELERLIARASDDVDAETLTTNLNSYPEYMNRAAAVIRFQISSGEVTRQVTACAAETTLDENCRALIEMLRHMEEIPAHKEFSATKMKEIADDLERAPIDTESLLYVLLIVSRHIVEVQSRLLSHLIPNAGP
ncbi:MAG: GGDEF domain-containing protein [Deltaproteobacteria bacterium]|nr:GGDEF domain-containing protein [Deltaproteobacteria bacterium]